MQLVDRGNALSATEHPTQIAGRLYHTDSRNEPHMSSYLLTDGDIIEIRPYWQFLFKQETLVPEESLNKLQMQESQLFKEKYTIKSRVLGAGSQGSVHLAVNTASKTQLVCKIINLKQAGIRDQHSPSLSPLIRRKPNILTYVDAVWSPHTLEVIKGEKQTTAADIWSLGIISLLLVSGCGLDGIDGLARLDQSALRIILHDLLSHCPIASVNAKSFVLSCMKTKASDRISSDEGERPLPTQLPDVLEQSQPRRLSDTVDFQQLAIAQYVQMGRAKVAQVSSVMPNNNRQRVVKVRRQAQQSSNHANKPPKGRVHDGRVEILQKLKSTNTRFLKD
ncbi:hypothetical protein MY5147_001831 [Beauveria neobassiana]